MGAIAVWFLSSQGQGLGIGQRPKSNVACCFFGGEGVEIQVSKLLQLLSCVDAFAKIRNHHVIKACRQMEGDATSERNACFLRLSIGTQRTTQPAQNGTVAQATRSLEASLHWMRRALCSTVILAVAPPDVGHRAGRTRCNEMAKYLK